MRIKLKFPRAKIFLKHIKKKYKCAVKGINNELTDNC